MTDAIYPGTFDPVTNGHVDIIERASKIFHKVIVAVYDAPPKRLLFTTEERVQLFADAVAHLRNVEMRPFKGLVVEYAHQVGAQVIVRGLRIASDFEYEFEMALMNRKLAPDVELVCLMSALEYQFVHSSRIKEVAELGGDVSTLVPKHVAVALRKRLQAKS